MYLKIWVQSLVERLRKLTGFRGTYVEPPLAMPVLVVNDGKELNPRCLYTERTTSGTSNFIVTNPGRSDLYITAITISQSASIAV